MTVSRKSSTSQRIHIKHRVFFLRIIEVNKKNEEKVSFAAISLGSLRIKHYLSKKKKQKTKKKKKTVNGL